LSLNKHRQFPQLQLLQITMNNQLANRFLDVQNELNVKLSSEWKEKAWPYTDAIFTEATEAYNHLNWEWWRATNRTIDWDQVKLEWVDVVHFLLSEVIVGKHEVEFLKILTYHEDSNKPAETFDVTRIKEGIKNVIVNILEYEHLILSGEWVFAEDSFQNVLVYFFEVVKQLGLTIQEFYTLFIGKVCLNQLRWKNGYKKGIYAPNSLGLGSKEHYVKIWDGKEDNVWLAEHAATLDPADPEFKNILFSALEAKYKEVYSEIWNPVLA
jgi:hypothetical protein